MGRKRSSGKNGRDSISKRLGVKKTCNEYVKAGSIIVRQRGTKFHAGFGVGRGGDDTLFAKVSGYVKFRKSGRRTYVDVVDRCL